jgi:hypothetical protein
MLPFGACGLDLTFDSTFCLIIGFLVKETNQQILLLIVGKHN